MSFYVDEKLIYRSNKSINVSKLENSYLWLGRRSSGSAGKSYHDYIRMYAPSGEVEKPPVVSFTYSPLNPVVDESVTFDASSSYDPDGTIVSYEWDFGAGNITSTTEAIITHSYSSAGEYSVKLTVTDNSGLTNSTTKKLRVIEEVIPNISWNMTITATNQLEPVVVGMHPNATEGYEPDYDVFAQTPVQGKVILILEDIYAKEINRDRLIWNLSVGVLSGQTTTLTWDSSKIPADVALTLDGIDMKVQNSMVLGEGSHSFVIRGSISEPTEIFDTGAGTYPSISGVHTGFIIPDQTITVHKLYTYPCAGTGGHTRYAAFYYQGALIGEASWTGYNGDWHNITFDSPFTLEAGKTYNYVIKTDSYPQIIHKPEHTALDGSFINCTSFVDANGKEYNDWIPAIRLE